MSRPFDEARYRALLEGLEISEVKLKEILAVSRFDSEYFRPALIKLQKRLEGLPHTTLGAKSKFVAGPFGSEFHVENYDEQSGFRYIRGKDVKSFFLESSDNVYIPENDYTRLAAHSLKESDVLISVVGTLGNACIATAQDIPAIFSCKSTVVRKPEVNPFYLVSFLNSKSGKLLLLRNARGTIQLGLNLPDLRQLIIPKFSKLLQDATESLIRQAQDCLISSKDTIDRAEQTLLRALGLENWQPPEPLTYTRSSRDAFAAGRLDAEYFQPQYEALKTKLTERFKVVTLRELGTVTKGATVPYSELGTISIIRSGDLSDIDEETRFLRALPSQPIVGLEKGDVLISSIGFGSIGKVQVFDKLGRYGTVSEVTIIRQKELNPYFIAAFFRSIAGQMQIERHITGATGQLHLYPRDVADFWIPVLDIQEQQLLERLMQGSRQQKQHARTLLNAAQRAVEIAIETDEAAALAFLNMEEKP